MQTSSINTIQRLCLHRSSHRLILPQLRPQSRLNFNFELLVSLSVLLLLTPAILCCGRTLLSRKACVVAANRVVSATVGRLAARSEWGMTSEVKAMLGFWPACLWYCLWSLAARWTKQTKHRHQATKADAKAESIPPLSCWFHPCVWFPFQVRRDATPLLFDPFGLDFRQRFFPFCRPCSSWLSPSHTLWSLQEYLK